MIPVMRDYIERHTGQIIGWGIALALLAAMMISVFGALGSRAAQYGDILEALPAGMMAALGIEEVADFLTPAGFIGAEFFSYMPIVLGILAISLGSGLIIADEEEGILDLLMAQPISRTQMFVGRLLGMVLTLTAILALTWAGMALTARLTGFELGAAQLLAGFWPLLAILLFFGTLSLLFSFVLPARRLASGAAGLLLVGSFIVRTMVELDQRYELLGRFSPLSYYQGGDAMRSLNLTWLAGLLAAALLFSLAAWWLFQRRDLRVGGEGGWHFRLRRRAVPSQ